MRKLMILASTAMLLIGQSALAQGKGGGEGQGKGGDGQAAERGGKGQGGGQQTKGRGGDRGQQARAARQPDRPARSKSVERGRGRDVERRAERPGQGRGPAVRVDRGAEPRRGRDRGPDRVVLVDRDRPRLVPRLLPGCPPGLARKNSGCLPPGQARKIYGDPFTSLFRYAPWYDTARLNDWRYMNGYAYRIDPVTGLIAAFLPLLGGGLFPGNVWPVAYTAYEIDPYYPRYYGYGDYDYRYVDGALFAVDPRTQRIDSIAALLAGDPWAVGRPIPPGYNMYNVPPPYRARYYDSPDAWYRYSDGYIYRVDPTTLLVAEAISLLA